MSPEKPPIRILLFRLLTSRTALIAMNAVFTYCTALILWGVVLEMRHGQPNMHELDQIIEGMAVISIAFGVALESREDIMEILRLYPRFLCATEERIDQVCKDFGIGFLLYGLFMEIPNQMVRIPNHIVNTAGIELPTLMLSVVFVAAILLTSLMATWRLIRLPPLRKTKNH
ncbi:MAG: hypothetical protein P4L36_08470 [Holophaga sp.]|nr:hypothetical protein [Holophaga sp.]